MIMSQNRDYTLMKSRKRSSFIKSGVLSMLVCLSAQLAQANEDTSTSNEVEVKILQSTITGTVLDDTGQPLPGANVVEKGTTNGTQTDFDGNYSLNVSDGATLVFSYIGFKSTEIAVNGQSSVNATLAEDAAALDEVIVTGYTTQNTRDITGSVSVIKSEDLAATSPVSLEQALQGQASGVTVGSQGGPGNSAAVRIRGFGTINANDPLYIIDGTPSTGGGLNDLNPNDIESIQVLKDASSAAIYGFRAANGVIIITTKGGKRDTKTTFNANAYVSVDFVPSSVFPDLASPQQIGDALFRAFENDGVAASNPQYGSGANAVLPVYLIPQGAQTADESAYDYDTNRITRANQQGTDWFDEYFNSAISHNYNVSASGGSENSSFFMSASALDQEGVGLLTGYQRFSVRANSTFNVGERFRVGENLSVTYSDQILDPGNDVNSGTIASLYRAHPLIPVYDVGGNFSGAGVGGLGNANNPIAIATRNQDNDIIRIRALGNIFGEYDIIKNLTLKTNLGFDFSSQNQIQFQSPALEGESENRTTQLDERNQLNRSYTWFNTLTYSGKLAENITLDVLGGTEFSKTDFRELQSQRTDFLVYDPTVRFLDNGSGAYNGRGFGGITTYFSLFGKADVKIQDKYLLSATIRRDQSSFFVDDKQSGVFPSGSVGWRISNEEFLKDSDAITSLLFKAGYGVIGNNGNIGTTARANTVGPNVGRFNYPTGTGASATGFGLTSRGNPDIGWETTTTLNIGFTSTLWDVLNVDFEWYNSDTEDLLLRVPGDPTVLGSNNTIPFNIGEMNNTGFDLTVGYANNNSEGDFKYNVGFNISQYKNEVIALDPNVATSFINGDVLRDQTPNRTQAGEPVASFFGKIWEGIDADGRVIFTQDPDGGDLRTFIGSPHPDFTYGLNFSSNYKNIDFSMLWAGSQGNEIYNFSKYFIDFEKFPGARSVNFVTENGLPAVSQNAAITASEAEPSTKYLEDGSYLRMKNIVLGYSLPQQTVNKLGLQKLRFYLQGKNLLTFTEYTGLDPEVSLRNFDNGNNSANLTIGTDSGVYPINRSIIFGINLTY